MIDLDRSFASSCKEFHCAVLLIPAYKIAVRFFNRAGKR